MTDLVLMGQKAKDAAFFLANLSVNDRNMILNESAAALLENIGPVIQANKKDIEYAASIGLKGALIDRLALDEGRIQAMAEGLRKVAFLEDPIGEVEYMRTLGNGLVVGKKRVPMGVIGIIYEARPNVTSDAYGLCLKAGSASILRGGKEAVNSNKVIIDIFQKVLEKNGYPKEIVQLIVDTSHETAREMMRLNGYIDVLIPRGGANLINTVVQNSTVPVIETGIGNCHIFVDESGKQEEAIDIIINAKTQRPGVCNACESLLVHESIYKEFLPKVCGALKEYNVEIRGDERVLSEIDYGKPVSSEDYGTEFLDLIISVKVVGDIDEAIEHIRKYGTSHSEAIITENYSNAQKFLNKVDAAAVYVNASTRFTDGEVFGFGAEIGISTQKLHTRGPMGLKELTTNKYIIYGSGQIR